MKKSIISVVLVLFPIAILLGQQGKYQRKSISSVESVWIRPGALQGLERFDYRFFDKMVDFYIELERFDYNILPETMLSEFRDQANSLTEITPAAIGRVLEKTVAARILDILNSDDVKKNRGLALKDESAFQSFAATKAKSLGLTVRELEMLLNSAYIYLPYISNMKQEKEAKEISVEIQGGILWYQLAVDPGGNYSIKMLVGAKTSGLGRASIGAKNRLTGKPLYKEFKFGKEVLKTTEEQYAQYDAVLAWAKNLGVKTKEIDAFKLQAQIVEASGNKYGFPLGFSEGVHLGDGFHLVEFEEDKFGNEVATRVGFVRVTKTGDNKEDPTAYTYATQLLGEKQDIGGVVMEHPRLGIDARVKLGFVTGMNIPKKYTEFDLVTKIQVLDDDATSAFGANLTFAYNLAPIIGVSQTFLDLDIGFGIPIASYTNEAIEGNVNAFIISGYLGVTKKLWFGRSNLSIGLGGGVDRLTMGGELLDSTFSYSINAVGIKAGADFEMLLNPDLSLNIGAGYKFGLPPMSVTLTWGNEELELPIPLDEYEDLKMGGFSINIGINYALGELPINIFGFLDPFKKY